MEPMGTVEALFDTEYDRLVGALGVAYDPEAAADAVQEAFIEADRRWTTIGGYDDPAAWVRRVALNRLRTGRRLGRRRSEILATIRPIPEADVTVELLDLRHAIDALAPQQRLAVCLVHLAGLTIEEAAAALEVAAGTVKSNLHDARQRLRRSMEEQHG